MVVIVTAMLMIKVAVLMTMMMILTGFAYSNVAKELQSLDATPLRATRLRNAK